jgi:hypothetical protein
MMHVLLPAPQQQDTTMCCATLWALVMMHLGSTAAAHVLLPAPQQQNTIMCCAWLCYKLCGCVPAGDVYEHAVLLALKSQSEAALESSFTQLKTFYADTRCVASCKQLAAGPVQQMGMGAWAQLAAP